MMKIDELTPKQAETARILNKLNEPGAIMALATDLEIAVVVCETPNGNTNKTAIVNRKIAIDMALQGLINCPNPKARIAKYKITDQGRCALKQNVPMMDETIAKARSNMRSVQIEPPLSVLARRREKDGTLFLHPAWVATGKQLFEDYEISRLESANSATVLDRAVAKIIKANNPYAGNSLQQASLRVEYALYSWGMGLPISCFAVAVCTKGLKARKNI